MNQNIENIQPQSPESQHMTSVLIPKHSTVKENCLLGKYNLRTKSIQNRIDIEQRRKQPASRKSNKNHNKNKSRAAPLSKYRRRTANARERNRMQEINDAFDKLKDAMPIKNESEKLNESKLTKITTLRMAVDYIKRLTEMLQQPSINSTFGRESSNLNNCATTFKNDKTSENALFSKNRSQIKPTQQRCVSAQNFFQSTLNGPAQQNYRPFQALESYFAPGNSPVVQVISSNPIACTYKMRLQPPSHLQHQRLTERMQQLRSNGTFAVKKKKLHSQQQPYELKRPSKTTVSCHSLNSSDNTVQIMQPSISIGSQANADASTVPNCHFIDEQLTDQTIVTSMQPVQAQLVVSNNLVQPFSIPHQQTTQYRNSIGQYPQSISSELVQYIPQTISKASFSELPEQLSGLSNESLYQTQCAPVLEQQVVEHQMQNEFDELNLKDLQNWFGSDNQSHTSDTLDSLLDSCNSMASSQEWSSPQQSSTNEYSLQTLFNGEDVFSY